MLTRRVVLVPLCLGVCLGAAVRAQQPASTAPTGSTEADFDARLAAVHAQMQKGKWTEARTGLVALVNAHARAVYAQAQCDAIASDLRTCAFYAVAKAPKLAELVTGKIMAYDESSGRLKVVYADQFTDFKGEGELLVNPIVFAGAYTVTMSGKAYPAFDKSVRLWFDLDPSGDGWFLAEFGSVGDGQSYIRSGILQGKGDAEPKRIAEGGRMLGAPGAAFKAVVKVGEGQVEMLLDNKTVAKAKREKVEFGQIGIARGMCDEIVLEGKIEPSCLQSRVDESLAEQREKFEKVFDPKKELPAWLFERPDVPRAAPRFDTWIPGLDVEITPAVAALLQQCAEGKYAAAAAGLPKLGERDLPPVARSFLEAWLAVHQGRCEQAEPMCAQLLAQDAEMTPARLLHGKALEDSGRVAEAIAEYQVAAQRDPGCVEAHDLLCVALLRHDRADEARRVVRDAKTRHGLWDETAHLETMLAMAVRGPNWSRRFAWRSTHYEVASDIDQKVCADACRVLEESYVNLMSQLTWIKEDKNQPRFRVFLFSGEPGYQEYTKAITGEVAPHTAGLYTPVLKQLLIWNVPRREDMVRTIRHEGFHQFLDRIMENPPTWMNEGTAEFWETAKRDQGRLLGGQVRTDHIATLVRSRKALPKLKDFAYGGTADFYAQAQLRYAQGWALVHFLRKGPPANQARFDKLWSELRSAKSTRAALDVAFAGLDWEKFEQDFWQYLTSLK